mmetsp:Transcript_28655/g.78294  ORF Transcript_28655/g.78294 Transcript_28655/m.78294 type:complete len:298 (-) Transcript_28655:242-1135(-)
MGQESSRVVDKARAAASKFARDFGPETDSASSILWEGVSDEMRWLVIAQVRVLLNLEPEVLLYRPDQLEGDANDVAVELGAHETQLATAALRDKVLGPKLQKARDALVPTKLSEPAFWDHFFSHVDVIKVKIVSDYLRAQELAAEAEKRKRIAWRAAFERFEPPLKADLKRAAEHICKQRPPAHASASEVAAGFDPRSLPRWTAGCTEAWVAYTEDGPWEIEQFLRRILAETSAEGGAVGTDEESRPDCAISSTRRPPMQAALAEPVTSTLAVSSPLEHGNREGDLSAGNLVANLMD